MQVIITDNEEKDGNVYHLSRFTIEAFDENGDLTYMTVAATLFEVDEITAKSAAK